MKKILISNVIALILGYSIMAFGDIQTARGEKRGEIVKLSCEGLVIHKWEAELIRGGMQNGSGAFSGQPFYFIVEKKQLRDKVQQALESGKEVKIKYHKAMFTLFRTTDNADNYFLDDIQ
jgi:hypothetical protein